MNVAGERRTSTMIKTVIKRRFGGSRGRGGRRRGLGATEIGRRGGGRTSDVK